MILFIAFRVVGMAGKPRGVSTVVKSTTPQTGKTAHFLGYTGTKSRLMNVLEWGLIMKYWQFVNWEPAPIESALKSRVAVAIAAYENGDKNAIKEYYRQSATVETLKNPVVKIGGWAFSLREFCRVYWVKVRYYGIMELYAPNKSAIYSVLGKYHVLKIQEVEQ